MYAPRLPPTHLVPPGTKCATQGSVGQIYITVITPLLGLQLTTAFAHSVRGQRICSQQEIPKNLSAHNEEPSAFEPIYRQKRLACSPDSVVWVEVLPRGRQPQALHLFFSADVGWQADKGRCVRLADSAKLDKGSSLGLNSLMLTFY